VWPLFFAHFSEAFFDTAAAPPTRSERPRQAACCRRPEEQNAQRQRPLERSSTLFGSKSIDPGPCSFVRSERAGERAARTGDEPLPLARCDVHRASPRNMRRASACVFSIDLRSLGVLGAIRKTLLSPRRKMTFRCPLLVGSMPSSLAPDSCATIVSVRSRSRLWRLMAALREGLPPQRIRVCAQ
jgi:hypothetical protein